MTKTLKILAFATMSAMMASCSVLTQTRSLFSPSQPKPTSTEAKPAETTPAAAEAQEPTPAPAQAKPEEKPQPATKAPEQAATQPQEAAPAAAPASRPTHVRAQSMLYGHIGGEWVIVNAGGHKISRDNDMPYITFSEADHRFYASNGCNVLNGDYTLQGQYDIEFANVLSTMMLCEDTPYEGIISSVLRDGSTVTGQIEEKGNESYLHLKGKDGKDVLVLRRHNMEKLNGRWVVTEIKANGDIKVDDPGIDVFLDVPELLIHGNTGCNFFNGIILIDPEQPNSISFSQMGVTMKMCHNADIELAMLVALEETTQYSLSHSGTLSLKDAKGKTLIELTKADIN